MVSKIQFEKQTLSERAEQLNQLISTWSKAVDTTIAELNNYENQLLNFSAELKLVECRLEKLKRRNRKEGGT